MGAIGHTSMHAYEKFYLQCCNGLHLHLACQCIPTHSQLFQLGSIVFFHESPSRSMSCHHCVPIIDLGLCHNLSTPPALMKQLPVIVTCIQVVYHTQCWVVTVITQICMNSLPCPSSRSLVVLFHRWVFLHLVLLFENQSADPPPPLYKLRQCTQLLRSLRLV